MKDFILRNKIFLGVIFATLALLVGGVYLFSKGSSSGQKAISYDILVPKDAEISGGIISGVYQPANPKASVTLVEFGDYQCPACGIYNAEIVIKALNDFAGKINYVFRDLAFIGAESIKSAEATYCAADQNKYWEFHEYLYSHQNGENKGGFSDENLKSFAKTLNLNTQTFNQCLDSGKYSKRVTDSTASGQGLGINSTPTFFVNGIKIENLPASYPEFKTIIQDAIDKTPIPTGSPSTAYHIHFDLKVYLNGTPLNFTLSKYQESKTNPLDPNIHFHDGNGKVVHVHKEGIALKEFFDSLKLTIPQGTVAYVNGKKTDNIAGYVPQDLDQILIGSTNLSLVSNDACIYSLKCPARGTPPPEDCVGGLGTGCTD